MKLLRRDTAVFDQIIGASAFLGGVLLIVMMLLICYEVVMRYFLHQGVPWAIDVSEYIILVFAFLGAAWLQKQGGHVRVDILLTRLNPKAQTLLNIATSALGSVIWLAIAWYGAETTWDHFQRGVPEIGSFSCPKFTFLAFISAGSLLFSIEFLRQSYGYIRKWKAITKKEQEF